MSSPVQCAGLKRDTCIWRGMYMLMLDTKYKVEKWKCALCVSTHFHLIFYL